MSNIMRYDSPAVIILPDDSDKVKRFLSFTDRSVGYQLQKMKQNIFWKKKDPEAFESRIEELKKNQTRSLLFYNKDGLPCTYSGLWQDLQNIFGWELEQAPLKPEPKRQIPWEHAPKFPPRTYQRAAVDALIKAGHGAIELPTGAGKTLCLFTLCKELPVQTVIMTPAKTITNQIYEEMVHLFGKKFVGKYGDGKKEIKKLFTIATGQALTRIEQGTEEYEFFSKTEMFIADEAHTTPSETFEKVCLGALKNAQYRFFVSATQMRNDGSDMVLKGITGPVVYRKDFKDLVEEKYLARPFFKVFNVPSKGFAGAKDINKETQNQLYLNPNVNKLAADFAYKAITLANRPTVILIEEFGQFLALKNYITIPFEFAHGGASNRENADGTKLRDILPKEYWDPDNEAIIERFNSGETKLLIGTSAIATGVDLRPTGCLIYLQGGMSEIKIKQAIGRGTRIVPGKEDVIVVDFKVNGSPSMERHCDTRIGIYEQLGDVQEI